MKPAGNRIAVLHSQCVIDLLVDDSMSSVKQRSLAAPCWTLVFASEAASRADPASPAHD